MKIRYSILLLVMLAFAFLQSCNNSRTEKLEKPEFFLQRYSYSLGFDYVKRLKLDSTELDFKYFLAGINDANNEAKYGLLDSVELLSASIELDRFMSNRSVGKHERELEKVAGFEEFFEIENGKFLENYQSKEGVKITESGLMYKILREGTGKIPALDDIIDMDFTIKFINNYVIDDTYKNGYQPTAPILLMQGWREAIMLMKIGTKFELVLPPELAYGRAGSPPKIPPNAILVFEVELKSIMGKLSMQGNPFE